MTEIFNKRREKPKRQQLRSQITESEVIMWSQLQKRRLAGFKFRRQASFGRYVVDFYCPTARLIIEIDGEYHAKKEVQMYDKIREKYLKALGLTVLRFSNQDINQKLSIVLKTIKDHLPIPPPYEGGG